MMIEIRRAKLEDAATLSALNVDVQRLHADAMPHLFKQPASDDFALQFMREQLADEAHNYFFIIEQNREAIGYIFVRIFERPENPFMFAYRRLLIDQISVKPAYQGKGAGKLLIQAVRDLALDLGIDTIALDTWEFNREAQAFFHSQGFVEFNRRMWVCGMEADA
jgi:diamine N-acetyltransferase